MWTTVLLVVFVAIAFLLLAALTKANRQSGSVGYPYVPAKTLFSAAERSFLGVLDSAVGSEYRVFGKVRVADIAAVKPGLGASTRQAALNRIASKHVDYVVCRADDLTVVCAVELNDKSHAGQRARARDELLAKVCQAIGLPLLVVPAKQAYELQDVRSQFHAAIRPPDPVHPLTPPAESPPD